MTKSNISENQDESTIERDERIFGEIAKNTGATSGGEFLSAAESAFKVDPEKARIAYNSITKESDLENQEAALKKTISPENPEDEITDTSFRVFANILAKIFDSEEIEEIKKKKVLEVSKEFEFLGQEVEQDKDLTKVKENTKKNFDRSYLHLTLANPTEDEDRNIVKLIKEAADEEWKKAAEEEVALKKAEEEIALNEQNNKSSQEQELQLNKGEKNDLNNNKSIFDNITYTDIALGTLGAGFIASVPFTGPIGLVFAGFTYAYAVSLKSQDDKQKKDIMKQVYENEEVQELLKTDKNVQRIFNEGKEKDPDFREVTEEADKGLVKKNEVQKNEVQQNEVQQNEVQQNEEQQAKQIVNQELEPTSVKEITSQTQEVLKEVAKGLVELTMAISLPNAAKKIQETQQNQEAQEAQGAVTQENKEVGSVKEQAISVAAGLAYEIAGEQEGVNHKAPNVIKDQQTTRNIGG
jgi:hypothetical protein